MGRFDCSLAIRALAEETRMRIMRVLVKGKCSVQEFVESLGANQSSISANLRILQQAGLVECAKAGQERVYGVATAFHPYRARIVDELDLGCCKFDFTKMEC